MKVGRLVSGKFRLERRLAEGGMGEIWVARNELTGRKCAIKFLRRVYASHPEALDRFLREARATGPLRHPSIVDVLDAGRDGGVPYIVLELLVGEGLDAVLARRGTLSQTTACSYLSQIARALDVAHAAGIVHRDVSPANVFLARTPGRREPLPKILDFGVHKSTGPAFDGGVKTGDGAVIGCPQYMSPEQASGADKVDARSDLWSIGAVLYECLAGTPPFRAPNYNALMCAIISRPHRPVAETAPGIDGELAALVERCLVKDRDGRFQSARQVAIGLARIAVRLSRDSSESGAMPRRRATDFVPSTWNASARPTGERANGPVRYEPWPVRIARSTAERLSSRSGVLTASAVTGACLGGVIGAAGLLRGGAPARLRQMPRLGTTGVVGLQQPTRSPGPVVTPVTEPELVRSAAHVRKKRGRSLRRVAPRRAARPPDPLALPLRDQPLVASNESIAEHAEGEAPTSHREEVRVATSERPAPRRVAVGLPRRNPYE